MNIPQNQFLHSQSFNSEFVEFVWRFPKKQSTEQWQFICQFRKNGSVYFELGVDEDYFHVNAMHGDLPSYTKFNEQSFVILFSEYFHDGKDLADLGESVVKYLNEL